MQDKHVIDELRRIEGHRGVLLPHDVVEAARPAASVLHSHFEWNDTAAAEKYRIDQARALIRVCVEVIGNGEKRRTIQAFVSLRQDRATGGGYRSMTKVLQMSDLRSRLIEDALLDMKTFESRFSALNELADVFTEMEKASHELEAAKRGGRRRRSA